MRFPLFVAITAFLWNVTAVQEAPGNQQMYTNRLANESSPYLRQHQHNPVDWYPWGDEAFEKAKAEDKPIFLSIGYSSCHWCHVMAHESFENESVAEMLNKHFVSIKVDREEHPDIDAVYMTATHLLTQQGGWPNSVWLTPDGRPWYAGTYFPREDSPHRIGFKTLLNRLAKAWNDQREEVEQQANQISAAIRQQNDPNALKNDGIVDLSTLLKNAQADFASRFDARNGGFGGAPKFPPHSGLLLLMGLHETIPTGNSGAMIEQTLNAMACGGIYDQIGGGFHRYSTDEYWLVPHFEKMLYDNATLMKAYARAYTQFERTQYKRIITETAAWLTREMTHPDGGFYAALDADSDGEEGKFYTWSQEKIMETLGAERGQQFCEMYSILPKGNFRDGASGIANGLNIPHLSTTTPEDQIEQFKDERAQLLEQRATRVRPGLDNKVITAWNGLMISALAEAGRRLEMPELIARAEKARSFIDKNLVNGDTILRSWCDGIARINGVLDDYASLVLADLDLYEATGVTNHLKNAERWMKVMLAKFADTDTGDLYMTANDHGTPLLRVREVYDQGSPSGIGLAAQAIIRLGTLTTNTDLITLGGKILSKNHTIMARAPSGVSTLLEAAHLLNQQFSSFQLGNESDAHISIPESLTVQDDRTGSFEFTFNLPAGWHLNDLFENDETITTPFAVRFESGNVTQEEPVESDETNLTWSIRLTCGEDIPETLTGEIQYQLCTDSVCLLPDSKPFELTVKKGVP